MTSIQDFVVQGGQAVTAGEVATFREHIAAYKLKAETLEVAGQSALREKASFLIRYVEDVLDDEYIAGDFGALPESVFAVRYLAKGVDIIPDSVPGVGYSDDAAVVGVVLIGHAEEFRSYGAKVGVNYDALV